MNKDSHVMTNIVFVAEEHPKSFSKIMENEIQTLNSQMCESLVSRKHSRIEVIEISVGQVQWRQILKLPE
jgi:hypothetical protein